MKEFNLNHSELLYFASFCLFGLLLLTGLLKAYLSYFTSSLLLSHGEKRFFQIVFIDYETKLPLYTRHEESKLKSAILIEVRNVVELGVLLFFLRSAIVCF